MGTPKNESEATAIEPTCSAVLRSILYLQRILTALLCR